MTQSTSIRLDQSTVVEMRLAAAELAVVQREPLNSDDDRIMALVDWYHATKVLRPTADAVTVEDAGGSGAR